MPLQAKVIDNVIDLPTLARRPERPVIDVAKERDLILAKKSGLPANMRRAVLLTYERMVKEGKVEMESVRETNGGE